MADITVELVSIERMLWSGKVSIITAETSEGEIGVLPGHEPMIGQLADHGVVTFRPLDGDRKVAAVHGGFLSVTPEKVTVLADWAIFSNEVDEAQANEWVQSDKASDVARGQAALRALKRARGK
ncbi:MAG: F0F1 ATP synthase subunit epsilon [Corynebacterium sp.]|nr:F0F1 ATP synthase subunit epsilon [Corynebacterium sp.]